MPRTTTYVRVNVAVEHPYNEGEAPNAQADKVIDAVEKAIEYSTAEEAITDAVYAVDADYLVRYLEVVREPTDG
jgi:hypothetical protein